MTRHALPSFDDDEEPAPRPVRRSNVVAHRAEDGAPQLWEINQQYVVERLKRRQAATTRAAAATLRMFEDFFGRNCDPTKLRIADFARYEDMRYEKGKKRSTVHRELACLKAAMRHAMKRERIDKVPYIEMPSAEVVTERRAATVEEIALLFASEMKYRIWMVFQLMYWTGHRAGAVEQLEWARVDFENGVIDFRVPGRDHRNKRRNGAFPISAPLRELLLKAKAKHDAETPDDPFVITKGGSTYNDCKAAWKAIGVEVYGFCRHAFRKTFVTQLVMAGEKLETAALLIADAPEMAGKHYFKLQHRDLEHAMRTLETAREKA